MKIKHLHKTVGVLRVLLLVCMMQSLLTGCVFNWPAEQRTDAVALFIHQPESLKGQNNWSGAHWNQSTSTLWLVRNNGSKIKGEIRAYELLENEWRLKTRVVNKVSNLDIEAITQIGAVENEVLVLAEKQKIIRLIQVDIKKPINTLSLQQWNISGLVSQKKKGFEGMAFIPCQFFDKNKQAKFISQNGKQYVCNDNDIGGLVMLSHQKNGHAYAVQLNKDESVVSYGEFEIGLSETRALEFDRSTGYLYALDQYKLVVLKISGKHGFEEISIFTSPTPKGVEGLAITPAQLDGVKNIQHWAIITDDENKKDKFNPLSNQAVLQYNDFVPLGL